MQKYVDLLKDSRLKVTPQRLAIVSLMDEYGHVSVREIFDKIKESFPSLSLATVYKNINAMVENNFIKELKLVGEDSKYELVKGDHSHMICKKCGKVEDIVFDTQQIVKLVTQKSNYKVQEGVIHFFGLCPNCQ